MNNLDQLVDEAYRGRSAEELLKAPVSALMGVSKGDEKLLFTALGIRTIEDLASHWSVQRSQAIVLGNDYSAGTSLQAHGVTLQDTAEPEPDVWASKVESLLGGGGAEPRSLKQSWINLQVYCHYSLVLPTNRENLKTYLKTDNLDLLTEPIIKGITDNYTALKNNADHFLTDVYDKVVDLGHKLKEFADDAKGTSDDSIFQTILNLLEGVDQDKREDALSLLDDRIEQAKANSEAAGNILTNLASFKNNLTTCSGNLSLLKAQIEENENISQNKIALLSGTEDTEGSIANYKKQITHYEAEYKHDVIVAATTPTYAWVIWPVPPVPVGLIAAGTVATVFTKQALGDLDEIDKNKRLKTDAEKDLQTAQLTQAVQNLAETSVDKSLTYTNEAIQCTATLQNSWSTLSSDLTVIKESLNNTVTLKSDDPAVLKADSVVKVYVRKAKTKWTDLSPAIDTLMTNAYISVIPSDLNWATFRETVTEMKQE